MAYAAFVQVLLGQKNASNQCALTIVGALCIDSTVDEWQGHLWGIDDRSDLTRLSSEAADVRDSVLAANTNAHHQLVTNHLTVCSHCQCPLSQVPSVCLSPGVWL
jgi:hypothetical protein